MPFIINQLEMMSKMSNNADAMPPSVSPHFPIHQCSIQALTACRDVQGIYNVSCSIIVFFAFVVLLFRELFFPLVVGLHFV